MIKSVFVTVESKTPLLMHRFPLVPVEGIEKLTPEEQAEHSAYRMENGELYFPGINIQRALIAGAVYSKGKGRASLQKSAAACLMVDPEYISLHTKTYILDARAVVIPATKGRIVRYRPRLDDWTLTFNIEFDAMLITKPQLNQIIIDTFQRVGIGDFRPEKKGPFGRGILTEFKD